MDCKEVEGREILDAYLLGRLTEVEREDYERHFFECASCFSQVQTGLALQQELRNQRPPDLVRRGMFRLRSWTWPAAVATATLSLILVLGSWWHWARHRPRLESASTSGAPQSVSESQIGPGKSLDELARVIPPPYKSTVLRGTEDEAQTEFSKAMENYQRGEYGQSVLELKKAVQKDSAEPRFTFYLAVCYLLTNQTDSAIDWFQKTISLGNGPYSAEARFYLAKAYLRERRIGEARNELQVVVRSRGEHSVDADAILRQLPK